MVLVQTKEEIAHDVKEQLTKSMSSFGFMIIQTLVTDIEPDMKVRAAMNEINAAQRMRCPLFLCSHTMLLLLLAILQHGCSLLNLRML